MLRTYSLLILLAALTLVRQLPAQMVPDTSSHDLLIPYLGFEYARISAADLDIALKAGGAASLNGQSTFDGLVMGITYLPAIQHFRPLGIGFEYSINTLSDDGYWQRLELSLHTLRFLISYPFPLGPRWSGSAAIGDIVGYATARISPAPSSGTRNLDSALAQSASASHEIRADYTGLTATISINYAIPVSSDTLQTRFLGLHLRTGTELPIFHRNWSVDGAGVDSDLKAPYRPIFIDLLFSFFTRENGG